MLTWTVTNARGVVIAKFAFAVDAAAFVSTQGDGTIIHKSQSLVALWTEGQEWQRARENHGFVAETVIMRARQL